MEDWNACVLEANPSSINPLPGTPVTLNAILQDPVHSTSVKVFVDANYPHFQGSQEYSMAIANPTAPTSPASANIGSYPDGTYLKWYIEVTDTNNTIARYPFTGHEVTIVKSGTPVHPGDIVINEINYDPYGTDNTQGVEFVELYNNTSSDIDLSFYRYSNSNSIGTVNQYFIPENTHIPADGYLILTPNKATFQSRYSHLSIPDHHVHQFDSNPRTSTALGNAGGDKVNLVYPNDARWLKIPATYLDFVPYEQGTNPITNPTAVNLWPGYLPASSGQPGTANYKIDNPNNSGQSIELIHPDMDNSIGTSWKVSVAPVVSDPAPNPPLSRGGTPYSRNSVYSDSSVDMWQLY